MKLVRPTDDNEQSPRVTIEGATDLLSQMVRVRGRFAGRDFCYDGILTKIHQPSNRNGSTVGAALEIVTDSTQYVFGEGDLVPWPKDCTTPPSRQAFVDSLAGDDETMVYAGINGAIVHKRREVPVVAVVPLRSATFLIDGDTAREIDSAAQEAFV